MLWLVFDDCLSNTVCLLELCEGDDAVDEEDVDCFWCLALGDDVCVWRHGEFSLLVVSVQIGDGSGYDNMIFYFIFGDDSVSGDKGDTGKLSFFMNVLTKMRNDLKPFETTQKLPETFWN